MSLGTFILSACFVRLNKEIRMTYTIAPLMLLSDVSPSVSAEYSVDGKPMTAAQYRAYLNRNDKQFTLEVDYVCDNHQVMASKCGCLNLDDYCRSCLGLKTVQYDGKYCMMCEF